MKRFENMSKKYIIKLFVAIDDSACSECHVKSICASTNSCNEYALEYLQQDIDMKPRISTIDSIEGLEKAFEEYSSFCDEMYCTNCKYKHDGEYNTSACFKRFLAEEIEVVE